MTRIVAGAAGGRTLVVPRSGTRPTSDRVREALFSRLEHQGVVTGAVVLDLYAGSGALGLEAASRGAGRVVLVDAARDAVAACRRNVRALGLDGVEVVGERVLPFLRRRAPLGADLVLVDPPYDLPGPDLDDVLAALVVHLAERGVVVVERSARVAAPTWPPALVPTGDRRYGETAVWFAERATGSPAAPGADLPPTVTG